MSADTTQLVSETRDALQDVRGTLIELFSSVEANPEAPQDVARKLGINRNLTWKLSRVMTAKTPFNALNFLPGGQGIELALKAFRVAGAPELKVKRVAEAMQKLTDVIETHADDREHLELTLESMGLFQRETRPESGLELAYRGNSMVWGVHARARVSAAFFAPGNNGPATVDYAQIAALLGFRRLRPSARWRLYRMQMHDDKGAALANVPGAIGSRLDGDPPLIFREFCSPNMPKLDANHGPEGVEYVLPGGPVGNTAAFDCVTGYSLCGLPAYRDANNEFASTALSNTMPVETIIFDLIVHQRVNFPNEPEVAIYGFPHGGGESPAEQRVENRLPVPYSITELAGKPPVVATPLVPRYSEMFQFVMNKMNWNPSEFRGWRVQISHPPMASRLVLRWPLCDPPAAE
ncbi:MAG: hypothetical protein ACKVS9_13460 [Phycisphaerae bacterium]